MINKNKRKYTFICCAYEASPLFNTRRVKSCSLRRFFFPCKIFIRFLLFAQSPMSLYKFVHKDVNTKVVL